MSTHRPIYMTAAMVMTVLLAVTVLLAQDNPEAVILTEEEFQALLAAGGDTPVGTILTDEQLQVLKVFLAAEKGDAEAQYILGFRYEQGNGVPQDDGKAVHWYSRAAAQGDARGQFRFGNMYASGRHVPKNEVVARRLYSRAAAQGHPRAQLRLGFMYRDGAGALKDSVVAHMWFNIAGANGAEGGGELRDSLERDMTRAEISRATELARECMASDYQDCER